MRYNARHGNRELEGFCIEIYLKKVDLKKGSVPLKVMLELEFAMKYAVHVPCAHDFATIQFKMVVCENGEPEKRSSIQ